MKIHLVLVTYNRLFYTKKALKSILEDKKEDFILTIWDNASSDGTQDYLKSINDPRINEIIFSPKNIGQIDAVNNIWSSSDAYLLGKLDNDCVVTPGWTRILSKAHQDIDNLGVVACWHFFEDDFDFNKAKHKIQEINGHKILRHPWTCGTGFLIKRETYLKYSPMAGNATTDFWIKLAKHNMINGFYYPLIFQEHMDDPKSQYSVLKDEESFQTAKEFTAFISLQKLKTLQDMWKIRERIINNLLCSPWDVKYYIGWRGKIRNLKEKMRKLYIRLIWDNLKIKKHKLRD